MFDIASPKKIVADRKMALMSALGNCLPFATTLLCRLHIIKNIIAKMRRYFDSTKEFRKLQLTWNCLVQAQSATEYDRQLVAMRFDLPANVIKYLNDTWLVYKKLYVDCYLHGCLHYGQVTASRVESAHAAIKKWLKNS